jgi:hypothetical protein
MEFLSVTRRSAFALALVLTATLSGWKGDKNARAFDEALMRYKKKRLGMSGSSWTTFASVHWLGLAAVRCLVILTLVSSSRSADLASQVFEKAAASVFVVSVRDGNGSLLSLGTGFLIAKNTLATSLHVLRGCVATFVLSTPGSVKRTNDTPAGDLQVATDRTSTDSLRGPLVSSVLAFLARRGRIT